MTDLAQRIAALDPIWARVREDAEAMTGRERMLGGFIHAHVLNHERLEDALSYILAHRLGNEGLNPVLVRQLFAEAFADAPHIGDAVRADMAAVYDRDPAIKDYLSTLLYYKGFHAIQSYRIAHWLWGKQRTALALFLQNRMSEVFGTDIHPAAKIGRGIFVDHATGVVIGETAVVEDDVSMLHEVTLGGTGKESGDRHPKIRRGVLIGAGAKILGNLEVGECARVGAGSVVLRDVPAHRTVTGVPAKVVGEETSGSPSHYMDHMIAGAFEGKDGAGI